jgi:hypothetical protein
VDADGSFRHTESAGDLGVDVPGGDQAQHLPVTAGKPGHAMAAAFGVEVGLVQLGAQQRQQVPVALGEVPAT